MSKAFQKFWEKNDFTGTTLSKSDKQKISKEIFKASMKKESNPWAICTASVGRESAKYEDCVMDVKGTLGVHKDMTEDQYNKGSATDEELIDIADTVDREEEHEAAHKSESISKFKDPMSHGKRYKIYERDEVGHGKNAVSYGKIFIVYDDQAGEEVGRYPSKAEAEAARKRVSSVDKTTKDVGIGYAGPTPKSGLAEQDLEVDTNSTTKPEEDVSDDSKEKEDVSGPLPNRFSY